MRAFATLLERLILTPSRNQKLRLMVDYFARTPDPDRGYAVAAITRDLDIANVKPALLRGLAEERMDPVLFGYSYDYVGDLAETVSLIWPTSADGTDNGDHDLRLKDVVETLQSVSKAGAPKLMADLLDSLDATPRWALLKLVTGGLRIGVSARLVKQALADFGDKSVTEIEELWHGLDVPYEELFAWLEGRAEKPISAAKAPFRPVMLAHPLEEPDFSKISPDDFAAEWKWDGIRIQAVAEDGVARLYSRTGDDISRSFPDILEVLNFNAAIDGELLVMREQDEDGSIKAASFGDLQQRLNRKTVSRKHLTEFPAFIRAYDLLHLDGENLRPLPFKERRARLETFVADNAFDRLDLSPLVPFDAFETLADARANPPDPVIEGLMLKRWESVYEPGRIKGPWFKWKKDPHSVDAVLMYAQRGHGKRSSYYSDYTFGVWSKNEDVEVLVPVGKAYFGFTDEELKQIDKFVRNNTTERFGPVRAVRAEPDHGLVLEVAFEGLNRSTRHKSGIAMRFPRISRLRWDKPPSEADRIAALEALLD
ncbi:MAG: cisplatin damage response ATP-dependent DNA ligase [Pseudomonadota bacterium]